MPVERSFIEEKQMGINRERIPSIAGFSAAPLQADTIMKGTGSLKIDGRRFDWIIEYPEQC